MKKKLVVVLIALLLTGCTYAVCELLAPKNKKGDYGECNVFAKCDREGQLCTIDYENGTDSCCFDWKCETNSDGIGQSCQ